MHNLDKQFPWLSKIPSGSHGSGKYQKKLWKVTSDFVRIRDFHKYKRCISCHRRPSAWNDQYWQACHYRAYSVCKGYSKWDVKNIFGGCGYCNTGWNANEIASVFKNSIIERYGKERLDILDMFQKMPSEKLEDFKCVLLIKEVIKEMKNLPEQPNYYITVVNSLN